MKRILLAAAAVVMLAGEAHAGMLDGQGLYQLCRGERSTGEAYVVGVVDTFLLLQSVGRDVKAKGGVEDNPAMARMVDVMCIPKGLSSETLFDVVCEYLERNPGERHLIASDLTWIAMMKTYQPADCPSKY